MLLLVDVGNSNIVFGICENNKLLNTYRIKTVLDKTSDEYYLTMKSVLIDLKIDDVIISSVVPIVTSALKKVIETYLKINPIILSSGIKTGVQLKADDPRSVGSDLVCDVVAASKKNVESLVIDLGTATKYIYVKNNTMLGVSISPGLTISMKALISSTALLPNIELQTPKKILCNNTINCMQSGVIYGFASQIDGMITRIKKEVGNPNLKVIATGGLSKLIIPLCEHKIEIDENLVLEGLMEIYYKNKM